MTSDTAHSSTTSCPERGRPISTSITVTAARAHPCGRAGPVTLFGPPCTVVRRNDVSTILERLAAQFSDCSSFEIEVLSAEAGSDFGYIAAIERTTRRLAEGRLPRMRFG